MGMIESTRKAYGSALCQAGADERIVVFDADLSICNMTDEFAAAYPDRFYNVGIAECNMAGIAAGAAACGKIPFINSFAMFSAGRIYDQVRNSICYPRLNVKVVGTHAGLNVGEDGATHQCIEDLSLMRTIPNMTVICPCDSNETREAVHAMAEYDGPCYLRLGRAPVETVTTEIPGYHFELGKGSLLRGGDSAAIIATGIMVQAALRAAEELEKENIYARVIDMHTIKPIDRGIIVKAAEETGAIVTTEEHNIIGGLGSAVSEVVCETKPVPVVKHGVEDVFGHSGTVEALMERYGLTVQKLMEKVRAAVAAK